ncbi:MAG: phosphoenolpyruvate synthase [Chloroflexota bacterium]|nr:MAG: phosphoenolpyruvate synthase [Chloroflexota bacterium]
MNALVLPLVELDRASMAIAGGKATNLGELLRAGFSVPDGVCITTEVYRRLVAANRIGPRLSELLAGLDVEDADQLATTGTAIRALLYQAMVPEDVSAAVTSAAWMLNADAAQRDEGASTDGPRPGAAVKEASATVWQPLAVRSSATAEDLPEASFAGQQDTYLNVVGETALLEAVRRCWASLWTDRAIFYRHRNGIPQTGVALAVVVQRMVAAETAGVLFTANPVSGKRSEMTIEASLGLGEAVVSGMVTPDKYVVDSGQMSIVSKEIGPKTVQVMGQSEGGTRRVPVAEASREIQALPDDAIIELARLGRHIEEHFGVPQDVEWSRADDQLYVLQSRPITSLYPAPPPAPVGQLYVYVSLNSMQGMLEPFTPMGCSLFLEMLGTLWRSNTGGGLSVVELGGRLYLDSTGLLRSDLGRKWATFVFPQVEPVVGRILGELMADPRLRPAPEAQKWNVPSLVWRYRKVVLPIVLRIARFIAFPGQARHYAERVVAPQLAAVREELYRAATPGTQSEMLPQLVREGLLKKFMPRLGPLVAAGMLCYRLAEALARRNGLDERLLLTARQGLPYNKTTLMDLELWALAKQARDDEDSRAALTAQKPAELAMRYREGTLPTVLQQGMAVFLSVYGHRGVREIDIGMPRWGEDPTYLFGVLRNYLAIEDGEAAPDRHFAKQARAGEQAVTELVDQMKRRTHGRWKAMVLRLLLWRYRALGGLRETPKFYMVWLFAAAREALRRSGARLAEMGVIERPEDVFFLQVGELGVDDADRAVCRRWVAERRRTYERELKRQRAPRVITSEGEGFYGELAPSVDGGLRGTGVSPGMAIGRARVVRDPIGARLEPGEILVAPSTDPAWTPLFLAAGGLVMEAGGMMSHGAIVAREYGIPAVVGVVEATTRIADGQEVEVDGNAGVVHIKAEGS